MLNKPLLRECIEDCKKCIAHCKKMGGMSKCIKACEDCIQCCKQCLITKFHHDAVYQHLMNMCVSACGICEKECGKHHHDECIACAASCKKCKEACKKHSRTLKKR